MSDLLDRYGESHHRVGAALHNVAVANLRAGLLSDAKDAIEEAVRIRKSTLGDQSSKLAVSLIVDASGRPSPESDFLSLLLNITGLSCRIRNYSAVYEEIH